MSRAYGCVQVPWCGKFDHASIDISRRKIHIPGRDRPDHSGCAKAVLEFFGQRRVTVHYVREDRYEHDLCNERTDTPYPTQNPSWWVVVPSS